MPKDFKAGMVLGLILVSIAAVWLSTHPGLSTKARMSNSNDSSPEHNSIERFPSAPNSPNTPSTGKTAKVETKHNNEPDLTVHKQAKKIIHTVREGETLSDISYLYYGSENKWRKIHETNRKTIKDANKLKPGTKLIIPP